MKIRSSLLNFAIPLFAISLWSNTFAFGGEDTSNEKTHCLYPVLGTETKFGLADFFRGITSHARALGKTQLDEASEKILLEIRDGHFQIQIHESQAYGPSTQGTSTSNKEASEFLVKSEKWISPQSHVAISESFKSLGFISALDRGAQVFQMKLKDSKGSPVIFEISVGQNILIEALTKVRMRVPHYRVRVLKNFHEYNLPIATIHLAADLALYYLNHRAEKQLLNLQDNSGLKPAFSGSQGDSWLIYPVDSRGFSIVAMFYLSRLVTLSESEIAELRRFTPNGDRP